MADPLTPAISDRICKHMNEDHAEAIVLYAKCFGNVSSATAAQLKSIDAEGMDLQVESAEESQVIRIQFDHALTDSEDAHQTLISMVKQARSQSK
jgi:putative heme iron utilization protein